VVTGALRVQAAAWVPPSHPVVRALAGALVPLHVIPLDLPREADAWVPVLASFDIAITANTLGHPDTLALLRLAQRAERPIR
jgi:hypothetical protein